MTMAGTKFAARCALLLMFMLSPAAAEEAAAPPAVAVVVETVKAEDMAQPVQFPGLVVAPMKVGITSPASGTLGAKLVPDGSLVKKDDLLFTVDKSRYQALLAQSQAQLEAAQIAADSAQSQFDRTADLVSKGTLPKVQYQTDLAALNSAKAAVKVQEAALRLSQLDLDGTDIHAPFDGRLGQANFAEGAMVGPQSGPLATLMSLDPMRLRFYVRQKALLDARAKYGSDLPQLVLTVKLADGTIYDQTGKLLFTDVEANSSTDSVSIVGEIANPAMTLLDGQLVTVLLGSTEPDMQPAVSQAALMLDQTGSFVLTVDKDNKVGVARVTLGTRKNGKIAVTSGLKEGDRVIVAGLQKVAPGMVVAPAEQTVASAGTAP